MKDVRDGPSGVMKILDAWRFDGAIGRATYAKWGVVLMAIKLALDWAVSELVFGQPWSVVYYYLFPVRGIEDVLRSSGSYHVTMVALALPFLWAGVALTLRRLRDLEWPALTALVFVIPIANLLLFALLAMVPAPEEASEASTEPGEPVGLPTSAGGRAALALVLWLPFGIGVALLSTHVFEQYSVGLFALIPFALGLSCGVVWNLREKGTLGSTLSFCCASSLVVGLGFFVLGLEGIICLAMAMPLILPLVCLGGGIAWLYMRDPGRHRGRRSSARRTITGALVALPALMGLDAAIRLAPPTYDVTSTIIVAATPDEVWHHVVSFSEIPEPDELVFSAGIAYPVRAEIEGEGVGAVRRCTFTTGDFVEPIEVWDEPRLLRFGVTACPAPMRETSLWGEIHVPHLDGNFVSTRGQFLLEPLPDGTTRLSGTTWYHQDLWPSFYWRWWADAIIHRIHLRVLQHVKRLAESR